MNETTPVVLLRMRFEYRKKLKLKCFLWNLRSIRILMQGRETVIFSTEYSSTEASFSTEILIEEIVFVVAEMELFENRTESK